MKKTLKIIDARGNPITQDTAHYGASRMSQELAGWQPGLLSADAELLDEREILIARTHDTIRNHGLVSGAVQQQLDSVIGSGLRLSAKPDWLALGVKDLDAAANWEDLVEAKFNLWAYDIDCYCDAARRLNFGGMLAQGYRSYMSAFELLATGEWITDRPGAYFSTAIQMIDPLRLSNPYGVRDNDRIRAGIEFDQRGAPIAYYISSRVATDPYIPFSEAQLTWRRVMRETPWGRRQVMHIYDEERAGQSRGKGGIISVLAKAKMLEKFEQAHLQAAILNAMYAAFVESPLDWETVGSALGAGNNENDPVIQYLGQAADFHKESKVRYNGVQVPHLFPGEKFSFTNPTHPNTAFASFEQAYHRHMAGGMNMSYAQYSRDYSQTNYSSMRAALLDAWRFLITRREVIGGRFASTVYALWLEEAMDRGEIPTLPGAPDFLEAKCAWSNAEWIGPGKGNIDPLKEANATKVEYSMGLTTLEAEAAERGRDWRDLLTQRAQEIRFRKQLATQFGIDENELRFDGATPVPQPSDPQEPDTSQAGQQDAAQREAA